MLHFEKQLKKTGILNEICLHNLNSDKLVYTCTIYLLQKIRKNE